MKKWWKKKLLQFHEFKDYFKIIGDLYSLNYKSHIIVMIFIILLIIFIKGNI